MTVIVASLFLPYTVEFKIDQEDNINHELIKDVAVEKRRPPLTAQVSSNASGLVSSVNSFAAANDGSSTAGPITTAASAPIAQPVQNIGVSKLGSQSTPYLHHQTTGVSILNKGRQLYHAQSHQFSKEQFTTANSSVEDFFYQQTPVNLSPKDAESVTSDDNQSPYGSITQELSSKLQNLSNASKSSSSIFIPKSRVSSPPPNSITNAEGASLRKKNNVATSAVKKASNLKYSVGVDEEEKDSTNPPFADDDFEFSDDDGFDTQYSIPKYGGFSKKHVLDPAIASSDEEKAKIFKNFDVVKFFKGNGALQKAVKSTLKADCYKWLGTIGIPTDRLPKETTDIISDRLSKDYNCESVLSSDFTFQGHYKSFCKQILWPTLHYQIPDNPNSKAFEDHSWEFYKQLNQDFADKVVEVYKEGDIIWVHDYHLMLVPEMVREKLPNAKIGFFLHVSFPSSEVFKCFAQRESLLKGMLGANFISFQTEEYCRHFGQTCNKLLLADISKDEIRYNGHTLKFAASPVGIDADELTREIEDSKPVQQWKHMIRERWASDQKLIVGRDKFDRIRGVKQKLLSYEKFLKENPEYIENTTLIQICLRSKQQGDAKLEAEIMSIVDRINSLTPNITTSSQPVVFLHQDIEFVQYLALIAEADAFIVSSMREGMNLTCHEFIVATEHKKSPLILSEFTGSASVFSDSDVFKINPWDIKQFSNSIHEALKLTEEEKAHRWENLIKVVKNQDGKHWVNFNLERIHESWKIQFEKNKNRVLNAESFRQKYHESEGGLKLFIVNLSNINPSERILKILADLSMEPYNKVYIFSNYRKNEMERFYRYLAPRIGLIAENGGLIKFAGQTNWFTLCVLKHFKSWSKELTSVLRSYEERLPGSFLELGESFIKFHTESCNKKQIDDERKSSLIGDLVSHINDLDEESTVQTTSTETSTEDDFDYEYKVHATLGDDEIVYVQQSDISTKFIDTLINYYTRGPDSDRPHQTELLTPTSVATISSGISDEPPSKSPVLEFLAIVGYGNLLFEPVFEYVNELEKTHDAPRIKDFFTIGYDDVSHSGGAKEYVEGMNDLFSVLKSIS